MVLSIIIYIIWAGILYVLANDMLYSSNGLISKSTKFLTPQNILAIFIYAILYGIRYNVGVDNMMYIECYESLLNTGRILRDSFEPGYLYLSKAFANVGLHYSWFIGFWGALQIGFTYYALRRDRRILPYVALFIILGPIFQTWSNIMRQAVAECIFLFTVQYIVDRKMWKYIFWILIATLIHKSAIILIPFYFILNKPMVPKSGLTLALIFLTCTIIGWSPTWTNILYNVESVLKFLEYNAYTDNLEGIIEDANQFRVWGPARTGIWLLYILTIYLYPKVRKYFNLGKRFDIYFVCFFYGRCGYELVANTSNIFVRPLSYFYDFSIVIVPLTIYYLHKRKSRFISPIMWILAYFNTIYWTLKAYSPGGLGAESPEVYKFFFM